MFHLTTFINKISEKNAYHFKCLTLRLTHKHIIEQKPHQFLESQSSKKYLNSQFQTLQPNQKRQSHIILDKHKIPRRQNASQNSFTVGKNLKPLRNSASTIHHELQGNDLQLKRQRLMIQLRQVDLVLKSKHQQEYLSRIKRNKTQSNNELPNQEKAAKLIQKMNKQRKEMNEKKKKQVLTLKQNVEESIRIFKEYQEEKNQELAKKKEEIEKRIADRRYKAFERQKVNKISNSIIKQLSSYKVSLPQIYTRLKQPQNEAEPVLITGLEEQTIDLKRSRGKSFLDNIRKEDEQRVKEIEKKIEYQKNVRSMHLEYAKKQRLIIKSREKQASKSRRKF